MEWEQDSVIYQITDLPLLLTLYEPLSKQLISVLRIEIPSTPKANAPHILCWNRSGAAPIIAAFHGHSWRELTLIGK